MTAGTSGARKKNLHTQLRGCLHSVNPVSHTSARFRIFIIRCVQQAKSSKLGRYLPVFFFFFYSASPELENLALNFGSAVYFAKRKVFVSRFGCDERNREFRNIAGNKYEIA